MENRGLVGFEVSIKSSPELNEASKHWEKCGGQTNSLISNTIFAKTNISEKQISKKYTAIHWSLSGIHRNGDWKRKLWVKVRLLWVEGWVGCEKGKPMNGDSSFEKFFKKRKKRGWSRNRGSGKYHKMQGVGGTYSTYEDLSSWDSESRAEWVLMPSSWDGHGQWTVRYHQGAGECRALVEERVQAWGFCPCV